ncbi:cytochrome P450 [Streptomyces sp. NPDC008079]|uniref:cytochrome P450 n=1 Tax=Streptomyces sp. NPDC008079 TaxID=3364806 RepID=UPI0036EC6AEB
MSSGTGAGADALRDDVLALLAGDGDRLADPYPTWNRLREEIPVWKQGDVVILSRHEHVHQLLGDNNILYSRQGTKTSARYERAKREFSPHGSAAFGRVLDQEFHQLVRMDPPDHPRVRRAVQPPFSARNLAREMQDKVSERVDRNLTALAAGGGEADFKKFAYSLPLQVLGDLLGIPIDDLDMVHSWAQKIAENKFNADSERAAVEADEAYRHLMTYIDVLVARQRASGSETGLVAALLESEDSGVVSHEEAMAMMALMIFAGHETTSNLLAIGLLELLRHPDQWDLLVAEPERVPAAVEELLRFVTPAHFLPYVAKEGREVDGVAVEAGDTVIGVLAAANRDPAVFARPDELDIARSDSRAHVSLGLGPHFCLGAGLARMEATALFGTIARRFPGARPVEADLRWGGRSLRTPLAMPVRLLG